MNKRTALFKAHVSFRVSNNYLIRIGLGGPEGYHGLGIAKPHFGTVQYNPKKIILFGINPKK